MAHILKFGAAVEDIGNLEFTTPAAAITYWCNNMLEQHNSDWCQVDDVEFVQVGPMSSGGSVSFTKTSIDSRGFSFIITNPQNYNWAAGFYIDFRQYKGSTVIWNRILIGYVPFYNINAGVYHALDADAVFGVYNCASTNLVGIAGVTGPVANVKIMNSIHQGTNAVFITLADVVVNSLEIMNCFTFYSYMQGMAGVQNIKMRNNVLSRYYAAGNGSTVVSDFLNGMYGDLPAKIKAELPYNVFCFNFADNGNSAGINDSIDGIEPSRRGVSLFALFPHLWERNGTAFPTGSIGLLPHRDANHFHQLIEDYTPRRIAMAQIGPPEPRDGNPLRYFLNGWDANNGEQYGPCGYDWQEDYEFASPMLTVTPLPTLEMRLDWTIPPDLPAKFTKWEIYKRAAPPPATLFHFLNQNTTPKPTKIGEVARNVTTFLDDGSALTSVLGTEVSYRIRPVVA